MASINTYRLRPLAILAALVLLAALLMAALTYTAAGTNGGPAQAGDIFAGKKIVSGNPKRR